MEHQVGPGQRKRASGLGEDHVIADAHADRAHLGHVEDGEVAASTPSLLVQRKLDLVVAPDFRTIRPQQHRRVPHPLIVAEVVAADDAHAPARRNVPEAGQHRLLPRSQQLPDALPVPGLPLEGAESVLGEGYDVAALIGRTLGEVGQLVKVGAHPTESLVD